MPRSTNRLIECKDRAARHIARGSWSHALEALLEARELAPKDTYVARKIGDLYQRLGKNREAVAAYKQAAALFAAAGFLIKAISIDKIVLSLDPDDRQVQEQLAALYARHRAQEGWDAARPAPPAGEEETDDVMAIELARVDPDRLPWTPLLSDLEPDELRRVIDKLVPVYAAQGTVVCREGEQADSLFVISSGRVRVSSRDDQGAPLWLTNLSEGEFFGEFGFFCDGKRHADVVAVEDSELLQMSRADTEELVGDLPRIQGVLERFYKQRVVDTLLAKSRPFKSLTPDQRMGLLDKAAVEVHAEGSTVIQEGDTGESLYVIKSGVVDVSTELNGRRIELARLGPGDIFGEISVLTGEPTTANVVTTGRTELVKFSRREVVELAGQHPQLAHLLSETKAHRVSETVHKIQLEGFV